MIIYENETFMFDFALQYNLHYYIWLLNGGVQI